MTAFHFCQQYLSPENESGFQIEASPGKAQFQLENVLICLVRAHPRQPLAGAPNLAYVQGRNIQGSSQLTVEARLDQDPEMKA